MGFSLWVFPLSFKTDSFGWVILLLIACFLIIHLGNCSDELNLTGTMNVRSGRSVTYVNKTIFFDSSVGPIFRNQGSLSLVNCRIGPLMDPVDFAQSYGAMLYLENVTVISRARIVVILVAIRDYAHVGKFEQTLGIYKGNECANLFR